MIKVSSLIRCKVVGVVMWSGVLRVVPNCVCESVVEQCDPLSGQRVKM